MKEGVEQNITIFLRKTDGKGDKIIVRQTSTVLELMNYVLQVFSKLEEFAIYFKGSKLDNKAHSLKQAGIQNNSIIHIMQQQSNPQIYKTVQLRVFCQGSLYSYSTKSCSTFEQLKQQITIVTGCNKDRILLTYLGKIITNHETIKDVDIRNQDIISIIIKQSACIKILEKNSICFKPKFTESLTFPNSDERDPNYDPFPQIQMRKSSMKSSHDSRQERINQEDQLIRSRSQLGRSNTKIEQTNGRQLMKLNYLMYQQKLVETQSLHIDESEQEDGPESWKNCIVEVSNKQQNLFYKIQCNESHKTKDITEVLKKLNRWQKTIKFVFGDQICQEMSETDKQILLIAQTAGTKTIKNVIFQYIQN